MYGVASLVEVTGNRLVSPVFNVRKVFFEAGVEGASSFADVELSASGTINDVYNVVRQAVDLFGNVHLGFRTSDVGVGADEGTFSAFCLITQSGPRCSCGWLTQLRSHQHVTDVGVAFVCDQWWLAEDLCYFGAVLQETPTGLDDSAFIVGGWMVHKTDDQSLFGSPFVVWLKNLFTWDKLERF